MKRVIDGKIYNTETAEEICELPCRYYPNDFNWHRTYLYKTKKGAFFIAGEGNAASMWSRAVDSNSFSSGSGLLVVTEEEAREYAESAQLEPEEMAKHFALEEA